MGKTISSLRYVKNFNIENRAHRVVGVEKPLVQSPRHPSTARLFEEIEKKPFMPAGADDAANKKAGALASQIKLTSIGQTTQLDGIGPGSKKPDLRPKKENEIDWYNYDRKKIDPEYEKYGYVRPVKMKAGHVTLKMFDELINEYKVNKSAEGIKALAHKYGVSETDVHILVERYRPFTIKFASTLPVDSKKDASPAIGQVFPNLKSLKSS